MYVDKQKTGQCSFCFRLQIITKLTHFNLCLSRPSWLGYKGPLISESNKSLKLWWIVKIIQNSRNCQRCQKLANFSKAVKLVKKYSKYKGSKHKSTSQFSKCRILYSQRMCTLGYKNARLLNFDKHCFYLITSSWYLIYIITLSWQPLRLYLTSWSQGWILLQRQQISYR